MVIATDDLETTCPNCNGSGREEPEPCPNVRERRDLTAQGSTLLHL
ncbi:tryptophan RNA-binding attenuation protein [Bacillus licheniformis]|nr:tryptophan RNA-binding attenuation protein [Bacillus licheniformis]